MKYSKDKGTYTTGQFSHTITEQSIIESSNGLELVLSITNGKGARTGIITAHQNGKIDIFFRPAMISSREVREQYREIIRETCFAEYKIPTDSYELAMDTLRAEIIKDALLEHEGNQLRAAAGLRMCRPTLQEQMKKYLALEQAEEGKTATLLVTGYNSMIEQFEKELLSKAYRRNHQNITRTSDALKMKRTTLSDRLQKLGIKTSSEGRPCAQASS